jgi:hypothetical protein
VAAHGSCPQNFREVLVALPGNGEIFFCDSAFVMRGERQRHLVETDFNVGMMVHFLGALGDAVDKSDAVQETLELKGAANGIRALRPIGNGFQVKLDLFVVQGWHDFKLFFVFLPEPKKHSDQSGRCAALSKALHFRV